MGKEKSKKDKDSKSSEKKSDAKKARTKHTRKRAVKAVRPRKSEVKKELKFMLNVRKKIKKKKPGFKRQEGYRLIKLKKSWRRPRGRHSKLRKGEKARGSRPNTGYGSPKSVRGLTRHGYIEIRVSTPKDIAKLDSQRDAALISSTVGRKKREEILKKADELRVRVINR